MADDFDRLAQEAQELGKASLRGSIEGIPHLYGSAAFFVSATEVLVESTKDGRELGGACYFVKKDKAIVLVGLKRMGQGKAEHVAVDPEWGTVLWHTHPGLSFSIAAFSGPDIEGAKLADRPLLVVGYRSGSPDVIGLTQVLSLAVDRGDAIMDKLLRMGVAARVCWPDGTVRPVRRYRASGLREVTDDVTFQLDRVIGIAARQLETPALLEVSRKLKGAVDEARRRTRDRIKKK